jgi:hypothetical protein
VPIDKTVGLDIRDRWQMAAVEFAEEIDRVLDVGLALLRIAHDRARVRKGVTDVAVVFCDQLVHRIGRAVGDAHGCIVAAAIIGPGDFFLIECVTDGAKARGRHFAAR